MRKSNSLFFVLMFMMTVSYSQRPIPVNPGPSDCYNVTNMLWTTTPWVNEINISVTDINITFNTNEVCGATSYTWTVGNDASITSNGPSITLDGGDLLWLPAGGCDDYNDNWTSSNPLFNPDYPGGWSGQYPTGTYHTTLSVRSNLTSAATVNLNISGAEFCSSGTGNSGPGIGG